MATPSRVFAVMPDIDEPAARRDLEALWRRGIALSSASFHRGDGPAQAPAWPHQDLGHLPMKVSLRRLLALLIGFRRLGRARSQLAQADVVLVRNLDIGLMARLAMRRAGTDRPLVYQCLDIHRLQSARGLSGALARRAERWLLAGTARLVVSSGAFVTRHFRKHYGPALPPVQLRENRVSFAGAPPDRIAAYRPQGGPLRLGLVGSLRCPDSLDILLETARALGPDRVEIRLHGALHDHALPNFRERIAAVGNARWTGPFRYPADLARIYGGLDLVWAQDLWQRGGNSNWLLPNRIYEAGYFGCPAIACAGSETAAWIAANGTGYVLPAPDAASLIALLDGLAGQRLARCRRHILSLPAESFMTSDAALAGLVDLRKGEDDARGPLAA